MCVAFCFRRSVFFWTHDDCVKEICPVAGEVHPPCRTCRYQGEDGTCALTRASLPESGCCHWNVLPVDGPLRVTPAMVAPLSGFFDAVKHILADLPHEAIDRQWRLAPEYHQMLTELGISYQIVSEGLLVDPTQVVLVIDEPIADVLDRLDAPYRVDPQTNELWVDPGDLSLPQILGRAVLE